MGRKWRRGEREKQKDMVQKRAQEDGETGVRGSKRRREKEGEREREKGEKEKG